MYKGSSTSFGYVEKVEDQVLEPCAVESGGGGSWRRVVAAAEEETGVELRRGDRQGLRILG
jgi:hypothetical protein